MRKLFLSMTALLAAAAATAQDTYESATLINEDLNGTARYVGMGGAMEALGADISTMSSNPAGIGLMRHSYVGASGSIVIQSGVNSAGTQILDVMGFENNKTKVSFDQAGFVYAMQTGRKTFINFGFNYHKSKNFNQILYAAGALDNTSQSGVAAAKMDEFSKEYDTEIEKLHYNTTIEPVKESGSTSETLYFPYAQDFDFALSNRGYIGEYEFNISGNSNNRFFWGVTIGVSDVRYRYDNSYKEYYIDGTSADVAESRKITGHGFDVKAGVIFRPVNNSPFRVGLYVHTPTYYDLKMDNYADLSTNVINNGYSEISGAYDFRFNTPWKFGISLGHTVGKEWAFGLTYEYSDYSTAKFRVKDGGWYSDYYYDDWYGDYYYDDYYAESSYKDVNMNNHVKRTLKGVSLLKAGVEYKPMPMLSLRLGYNWQSPIYKKSGYKDLTVNSYGSDYIATTAFTNWQDTHRITAGVGFKVQKWNFDLAYQYSQTNGEFYPFYYVGTSSNHNMIPGMTKVSNKRSQILASVGYTF